MWTARRSGTPTTRPRGSRQEHRRDRATACFGYDVDLALRQFKKVDPHTYKGLVDRENPQLSATKGLPTYTWQYIKKLTDGSASIRSISITLDESGRIVGVSGGD